MSDRMNVLRHWLEAEELPRCQHCQLLADERSFMCEECAGEADAEVGTLRQQLAGAVAALRESAETLHRVSPWWEHAERSFDDCPAESCVKARAALGGGN